MERTGPVNFTDAEVQGFFDRANGLVGVGPTLDLYRDWAEVYDATIERFGRYLSPDRIAAAVLRRHPDRSAEILDVACGTGLVGQALARHGYHRISGVDLSEEMLEQARGKGCYRTLVAADLAGLPAFDPFPVVVCAGALTVGHLGAAAFEAMAGLVAKGGVVLADVEGGTFQSESFAEVLERLVTEGVLTGFELEEGHFYQAQADEPAHGYYLTAWRD